MRSRKARDAAGMRRFWLGMRSPMRFGDRPMLMDATRCFFASTNDQRAGPRAREGPGAVSAGAV